MENKPLVVKVKPHSYQPTREELEQDIGIPGTTSDYLAKSILRPVSIQEEPVGQRRPRRDKGSVARNQEFLWGVLTFVGVYWTQEGTSSRFKLGKRIRLSDNTWRL